MSLSPPPANDIHRPRLADTAGPIPPCVCVCVYQPLRSVGGHIPAGPGVAMSPPPPWHTPEGREQVSATCDINLLPPPHVDFGAAYPIHGMCDLSYATPPLLCTPALPLLK